MDQGTNFRPISTSILYFGLSHSFHPLRILPSCSMAGHGISADLGGGIGAGLELSAALSDFAHTLGSGGRDIRLLASDVKISCMVLQQIQWILGKVTKCRVSPCAIESTQEVTDRCQHVLIQIEDVIEELQDDNGKTMSPGSRVKWAFQRPRIQLLQGSLRSCTVFLCLTVTTLEFAQRLADRRSVRRIPVDFLLRTPQAEHQQVKQVERTSKPGG